MCCSACWSVVEPRTGNETQAVRARNDIVAVSALWKPHHGPFGFHDGCTNFLEQQLSDLGPKVTQFVASLVKKRIADNVGRMNR